MSQDSYKIFSPHYPLKGRIALKLLLLLHLAIAPLRGLGVKNPESNIVKN